MAQEFSFDVVSKVDLQEVSNAVQQASKEIARASTSAGRSRRSSGTKRSFCVALRGMSLHHFKVAFQPMGSGGLTHDRSAHSSWRDQHLFARRRQVRHRERRPRLRRLLRRIEHAGAEPVIEVLAAALGLPPPDPGPCSPDCRPGSRCGRGSDSCAPTRAAPCAGTRGPCRPRGRAPS